MRLSENGIRFIHSFEGCELEAYVCPGGVWTIGYGHTGDVYPGQVITQEEADRLFAQDIPRYEAPVNEYNGLSQNQFDALVSFTYNLGAGCLYELMDSGDIVGQMPLYNKASGEVSPGLVRRRSAEVDLYLSGGYVPERPSVTETSTGYTVQPGDTLSGIAEAYGTTYQELARINNIADPSRIFVGQVLQLSGPAPVAPIQSGVVYVVQSGDTLSGIADNYGTSYQELARINGIADPSRIFVGQQIAIGGNVAVATPVDNSQYYTVQSGDSLWAIGQQYGVSVDYLISTNGIEDASLIYPGQELRVN